MGNAPVGISLHSSLRSVRSPVVCACPDFLMMACYSPTDIRRSSHANAVHIE